MPNPGDYIFALADFVSRDYDVPYGKKGYSMIETDVLVSVVIPTYSRPVFLKRCIGSVMSQTYKNIEIIVVDDNDPDTEARRETELVMQSFADIRNITYLKHDHNINGSAARNTGWRHSHGQYITFIDDDDAIEPGKIAKQVECLEQLDPSWGACYTGYRLFKEHGDPQISSEKRFGDCYVAALMRTMFMGSGSNLFLRKSVVDEVNGYDETFVRNQDIEFLVRVTEKYKLAYVDEVLLTIYQEGVRPDRTFAQLESIAEHYLSKFKERIDCLEPKDKERVYAVISLERCRVAFYKKEYRKGLKLLKDNKVKLKYQLKYCKYLLHRQLTGKSYGFDGL